MKCIKLTTVLKSGLLILCACFLNFRAATAQTTTILSFGFETNDVSWTYNQTTGVTVGRLSDATNARTGTWSAFYDGANGAGSRINSSVITPSLTFDPGYTYTINVYAKTNSNGITTGQNPTFRIARATTATNAAMTSATGADLLLNTSISSTSYSLFTTTFSVTSATTRFIGFQAVSNFNFVDVYIDDITITRTCNISSNAGSDQVGASTCGLTQVTLAGNTLPTGATGVWSVVSGTGGSFGNTASPTSTFTGTSGNTYTLQWTVSLGACTNVSDNVDVQFNKTPVIGACPSNIVQCNNHVATWTNPTATGVPNPTVSCTPASGSTFATGTTSVVCAATNICGTSSCSFSVTINTTPVIGACPSNITQCNNHVATWTNPTSTATPSATVSCTPASGSTFSTGTTAVTCTASNVCGSSSCSFNVTINESPVIGACPSNIVQCDNHIATWTNPTATGTPNPTVSCTPASGSNFATGTTNVVCTASNSCGTSSCSFSVTINTTPVIAACPSNITQCNNHVATWTNPSSTATPAATVSCSPTSGSTFSTGTTAVICTAANVCGSSSCSFNVTINESPVISACPSDIVQCDNFIATWTDPTATGTPNPTVTCVPASGSTFSAGTTTVTCTAANSCATSTCTFNVTINVTPGITCPADITTCNPVVTFSPATTGTPAPGVLCTPASGSTFAVGTTAVNCTATNSCGSATCSFHVNVNQAPVISACPVDIVQCDNHIATWTNPTATGAPAPSVSCSPASGSTFNAGTTVVTCTATNTCGTSTCSFNVTINDSPLITCPADIITCNSVVTFAPTTTGTPSPSVVCTPSSGSTFTTGTTAVNCTATNSCGSATCSFNVTVNEAPVIGACPSDIVQCDNHIATWIDPSATGTPAATVACAPASGSTFSTGTTAVTCTATNSCGSSSCSFNITINESPVIGACPSDIIQCDNHIVSFATPTSSGTPNATVSCSPASGSTFITGTTAVTCTATNSCGSSSCSFNVTINESPVIGACPSDIVQCDNHIATWIDPSATGTPAATVVCAPASGSTFSTGTTAVTCTATNSCGSSSCSFNVTINESPVIGACPSEITQCDNHIVSFATPSASGTPNATVSCSPASGSTFSTGTTAVTCTATNSCGSSSCSFNVTINESPVIGACPSDIVQCDNHIATWIDPSATGTPAATVVCAPASGSTFSTGTTAVTCTATNSCGSSSCSFNVTINESPVIGACPSDITQCDNHIVSIATPTASGTPNATVSCSPASGSTFSTGTTAVTCTATNSCGSSSCSFNVTINESPVIGACPSDIVQCDNHIATWIDPSATGTPAATVACAPASGSTFSTGTTAVTCTATNSCGSSSCSFNVTINESPVIGACPSDIIQCDNHIVSFATPSASGTPNATVSCSPASGSTFSTGTTSVTCTATNSCGSSSCSFNVIINESPVIGACPSNIVQCNNFIATWTNPSATGTPAATVVCAPASGSTFSTGTTAVTCTATNSCGSSSCSFNVTINAAPTVNAGPDQAICYTGTATLNGSFGGGATTATWTTNGDGSFDNITSMTAVYSPGPNDIINGAVTLTLTSDAPAGCTVASDQVVIVVLTSGPAQPGAVTGFTPACPGNTITFSITPVAGATTYTWNSIDATTTIVSGQGTTSVDILFNNLPNGQSTYPLSVIASNACGNSLTRTFAPRGKISQPSFINNLPTVVCQNTNGVTFAVSPVAGASSYSWSISGSGATIVGPSNGTSISVDFSSYTSVTISVTASNACMTTAPRVKTVTSTPAIPGTVNGQAYVCPNGTYTYSVAAVPGATTYNWSGPPGSVVSGNSNTVSITFGPNIPGGSLVSVTAAGNCNNNSSMRSKGVANGIPNIPSSVSGPASGQCGATGVSYSVAPSSTPPVTSYNWSVNNGATISGPNNLSAVTVDFPANFTNALITVVANNGCGPSIPRNLTVSGVPGAPVSISGNASPCANTVETYCASASAGATNYVWTLPPSWTVLNTTPPCITVLTGSTGGAITAKAANACGNSSAKTKPVSISCRESQIMNAAGMMNAQVYPNPASEKAVVKFSSAGSSHFLVSLVDLTGRNIYSTSGEAMEGQNMIELNLSTIAKGIYLVHIENGDDRQTIRLTVE